MTTMTDAPITFSTGELTTAEQQQLTELEAVVTRGQTTFIEVGLALASIRDDRLYRADHPTFEAYLAERWPEIGRRRAYQLMDAANVASNVNHGTQTITNERQARALSGLAPEQQRQAVAEAGANGKLTAGAIEQAAARFKLPADYRATVERAKAIGATLTHDGEYHLAIGSETRHSSQWALIKEAVVKAETPAMPVRRRDDGMYEAVLPDGSAAPARQHASDARAVGQHWADIAQKNAVDTAIKALDASMDAFPDTPAAPSAPRHTAETPDRTASPASASLTQPTGTIAGAPDWRPVADRAIRHLNWPPPRLDDPNEQRRVYQEARDLLAAMAAGLGYAPETVTTELAVQMGIYRAVTPEPPDTPPDDPPPPPDDIAARAAALGLVLTPAGDCLIPHWPDEDVREMTGMDAYETRGWLLRTAPALAGDRIAAGTLTLPGIGWDTDTRPTAENYSDVCAFLSDLAAAEASGSLDVQTIRDLGDVLEGLVAVFDDDTYSAMAGRVTNVQRGV